jgi:hypothetical protein
MRLSDMRPEARRAEIGLTLDQARRVTVLAAQFKRAVAVKMAREDEIIGVLESRRGRAIVQSIMKEELRHE